MTDKSASIRISFSVRAAAEELARKLSGVTVKIKGLKLHSFVRVSECARYVIDLSTLFVHCCAQMTLIWPTDLLYC